LKLGKGHLSFLHLMIGLIVMILYVHEAPPFLKALFIVVYFFSLWMLFAFKGITIMLEEEEEEIDDKFVG
jgi:hypothetical protein